MLQNQLPELTKFPIRAVSAVAFMLLSLLPLNVIAQDETPLVDGLPDRAVFVPIEELDAVFARDREGVLLDRNEFLRLYAAAQEQQKNQPRLPRGLAVTDGRYSARINGDHLLITAEFRVQQFAPGWHQLVLPFGNLSVEKATLNDQPAQLGRRPAPVVKNATKPDQPQQAVQPAAPKAAPGEPSGQLVLFHNQPGSAQLRLELSTPLESVGNDKAARFLLMPVTAANLSVDVPAGRHLRFGNAPLDRPAPADQPATYSVPVGGQASVLLLFQQHQDEKQTDSLTFAATRHDLTVSPGEISWLATTSLQVFGTAINRLICEVPASLEITDVESTGLENWELSQEPAAPQKTVLTLNWRQPFDGTRGIRFKGVLPVVAGRSWAVPELKLRNVTSHVGQVSLQHPAGVRVRQVALDGARAVTGAAGKLNFEVWKEDFSLAFETRTRERELQASVSGRLDLLPSQVLYRAALQIGTEFAPLFEVKFRLPAEWQIQALSVNEQEREWKTGSTEPGWNDYTVTLDQPLKPGQDDVTVRFEARQLLETWPVETDPLTLALPVVQLPEVTVVEGTLVVSATDDLDVAPTEITGLDPAVTGVEGERLSFQFQNPEWAGSLIVSRKPSRLSARTVAFTRLDREQLLTHAEAELSIEGGGLREIAVGLSEFAGDGLRFELVNSAARIVEQLPGAPADGLRPWTLKFDQRVTGTLVLSVTMTTPRDEAAEFVSHVLTIPAAERQNGFLAIEGAADQQLSVKAVADGGQSLRRIDPVDVPGPLRYQPQERIVAAYRYLAPGYSLTLSETRFDRVAVPTAICHRSNLATVIGRTGELQHRAEIEFVAVGAQGLRVKLPAQEGAAAELQATLMDGQPVEVRATGDSYLVPLPAVEQPDARRSMQLFYRTRIPPLITQGRIEQQPPQIAVLHSEGTEQPLMMLDQHWFVHYPDGTVLTTSEGEFAPVNQLRVQSRLGQWISQNFANLNRLVVFRKIVTAACIIVLLSAMAFSLRRLGMGVVGCAGTVVVAGVVGVWLLTLASPTGSVKTAATSSPVFAPDGAPAYMEDTIAFSDSPVTGSGRKDMQAPGAAMEGVLTQEFTPPTSAPTDMLTGLQPPAADAPMDPKPAGKAKKSESTAEDKAFTELERKLSSEARQAQAAPAAEPQAPPAPAAAEPAQAAAPPAPARPASEEQKPVRGRGGEGGRLSLSLPLEVPPGFATQEFRYDGNQAAGDGIGLNFSWQEITAGDLGSAFLALAVVIVLWLLAGTALRTRAVLAVLGITLPIALVSVAPGRFHLVLEGVLLGTLAAVLLWMLRAAVTCCSTTGCPWSARHAAKTVAQTSVVVMLLSGLVHAEDSPATPEPALPPAIVVPYDPAKSPADAERVLLTREQFLTLWNLANPDQPADVPAPVEGLLADSFYQAELKAVGDAQVVQVEAALILFSFREQQIALPVSLSGAALLSAKLDGQPAAVLPADNRLNVLVTGRGRHTLDLSFQVPAKVTGDVGQFTLPTLSTPAGRVLFKLPQKGLTVRVNGSSSAFRLATRGDDSFLEVPAGSQPLTIAWRPPEQQGMADAIVNVETTTTVLLDDTGLTTQSHFEVRTPQGSVADLTFDVPAGLRLRTISGPHLAGWELAEDNNQRRLRVFFSPPVTTATQLDVTVFDDRRVEATEARLDLQTIVPREITRETGTIGVQVSDRFGVRSGQTAGLTQMDVSSPLPLPVVTDLQKAPLRMAWRYASRPIRLELVASRRAPEAVASTEHSIVVGRRKIDVASHFRIALSGAPRAAFSLQIPEGFLLQDVNATHQSDWYVTESDGVNPRTLTIEFLEPQQGAIELVLRGHLLKEPEWEVVEVAPPHPLEISRHTAAAAVWFDDSYTAVADTLTGWKQIDPELLTQPHRAKRSQPLQFAFSSNAVEAGSLNFTVKRTLPRLSADGVVIATVADTFLDYSLALSWKIADGAADQFTFTTPKLLAGRLKFQGGAIRETRSEADGDNIRWTITLQDAVRGQYFALATATLPLAGKQLLTPAVQFLQPQFDEGGTVSGWSPLETQRLYSVIVNQSLQQLIPAQQAGSEPVTAQDLPIRVNQELVQQATSLLRIRDLKTPPAWQVRSLEQQSGAAASVNVADLTLVIAPDGSWRTQAVYTIRNIRRQFLAVRLPVGSKLLSLFVKDEPARPVTTKVGEHDAQLIPLPRSSQTDLSFQVKLVCVGRFEEKLPRGFTVRAQDLDLPAPQVVTQSEHAEFGIPVARTLWTVVVPETLDVGIIDEDGRTNVNYARAIDSTEAYFRAQLADVSDLLSVVSADKESFNRRTAASSNLKQLGLALHQYDNFVVENGSPDLQEQLTRLKRQLDDNQSRIQQYSDFFDQSGDGIPQQPVTSTDEASQRALVEFNNGALLFGNSIITEGSQTVPERAGERREGAAFVYQKGLDAVSGSGDLPALKAASEEDSKLGYRLAQPQTPAKGREASNSEKEAAKKDSGVSDSRQQLDRASRRRQSVSNLNALAEQAQADQDMDQIHRFVVPQINGPGPGNVAFGGGGLGGGGGGAEVPQGLRQSLADSESPEWTRVGGLSLPVDLPQPGYKLSFSKVSGEPKLALRFRSREVIDTGIGLVWTLVWLGVAAALVTGFRRVSAVSELRTMLAWILLAGGLAVFVVLPLPLSACGFLSFIAGLLMILVKFARRQRVR